MKPRMLIAGIGNIFRGDDAFGVEVVRHLQNCGLPEEVRLEDFGIRGYDLAYALLEGYETVILVDSLPRGDPPGTVSLLELDAGSGEIAPCGRDAHDLHPAAVLEMVRQLGGTASRLFLAGCEPASLDCEDGRMELSPAVTAAVPVASQLIRDLLRNLSEGLAPDTERHRAQIANWKGQDYAVFE